MLFIDPPCVFTSVRAVITPEFQDKASSTLTGSPVRGGWPRSIDGGDRSDDRQRRRRRPRNKRETRR